MRIIHKIKYKFSEPYRIRIGAGLSPLRNRREYNALIKFCRKELKDIGHMRLNPERRKIYQMTIKLHEDNSLKARKFQLPNYAQPRSYIDVHDFINDHVSWYWN